MRLQPAFLKPARPRAQTLRHLLEEQRDRILRTTRSRIREVREEGDAEAGDVLDDAEASEADVQADLELALLQMQRETLVSVEAALDELDAGQYGHCLACGDEIPTERLRALPFAIRCTGCEGAREAQLDATLAAGDRRGSAGRLDTAA